MPFGQGHGSPLGGWGRSPEQGKSRTYILLIKQSGTNTQSENFLFDKVAGGVIYLRVEVSNVAVQG